jgi:hypothetical protein
MSHVRDQLKTTGVKRAVWNGMSRSRDLTAVQVLLAISGIERRLELL